MSPKVKTRILIVSDTHSRPLQNQRDPTRPFREPLPDADVLIHCGDLTMEGSMSDYEATLDAIKHVRAPLKLVVAGNHDLTLDEEWMTTHEGDYRIRHLMDEHEGYKDSREFWTSPEGRARKEGVTFLDEGVHSFKLTNGAKLTVYASPYTPAFWDWGFPYRLNEDRFNAAQHTLSDATNISQAPIPSFEDEDNIDVLITHGPPYKRLDLTSSGTFAGCPHLLRALMRARPMVHCFGHIHEGWGAEIVHWGDEAKDVATKKMGQGEWREGGWKKGLKADEGREGVSVVQPDLDKASVERSVHMDVARGSGRELVRGKETLLVNASIVDLQYAARNAPMLVDVDLLQADGGI